MSEGHWGMVTGPKAIAAGRRSSAVADSSRSVFADWAIGLFRIDPASQRHKGLSLIFFKLDQPGVRVQPIPQIDGETGLAELLLKHLRLPAFHWLFG
ncbi:hypothetical protein QBK99_22410 [Corticibacterium sp. UT-5YL-CI-8]|nr:hypothetical protein [Tianweitania sp. UT-5YL-CI-8]